VKRIIILSAIYLAAFSLYGNPGSLNPIMNAGFEDPSFAGWGWYTRAQTSYRAESENSYKGSRCAVFTNESSLAPEVYGRLYQVVAVMPATEYELSAWIRGRNVSPGLHFTDWNTYTLNVLEGTFDWTRIAVRFRTRNDQGSLNVGINIVNRCELLAVDEIDLRPVGVPIEGDGFGGTIVVPGNVLGDNLQSSLDVVITTNTLANVSIRATIQSGKTCLLDEEKPIGPAQGSIRFVWNTGHSKEQWLEYSVSVSDTKRNAIASAEGRIEKINSRLCNDLTGIEERVKRLDELILQCKSRHIPVDYPMVTRTLLDQFIPLVREDIQRYEIQRAEYAVKDLSESLNRAIATAEQYLKTPSAAPVVKRYVTPEKASRGISVEGLSFIADRKATTGETNRGPVFFCGYGHFGQVRTDIPIFPAYGVNIIQIEMGPSSTLISETEVSLDAAQEVVNVLDNAGKHNIAVNILLSPHYFPQWAFEKWPHLTSGGGGFLGYCVDAPEAKEVISRYLKTVIPLFKGKPALHSFCLSNEPVFDRTAGCPRTRSMWSEYLASTHGDVKTLSDAYGTTYTTFADVPIPANDAYNAPQFYDYCIFNQERFTAWHKWMADIIHEMAPEVPVHAKAMSMALGWRHSIAWGVDPEMFGEFSQINGNDCWTAPLLHDPNNFWAMDWHLHNMSYDLQRSLHKKPIFNSENHFTIDRSTYYVYPEHFRAGLWQGAIHGESATTLWVWERTFDRGYDFYGNVMDRPGCAEAVGRTCLDLNRFAGVVTALQNQKAPVAILFSIASIARDPEYLPMVRKVYEALNFCGVKIDFISERQLAAGKGARYPLIVCPSSRHITRYAFESMIQLPETTNIVFVGSCLQREPYGRRFPEEQNKALRGRAKRINSKTGVRDMSLKFREQLDATHALPELSVLDAATDEPVWGVEWLTAELDSRIVLNLINLTQKPVDVIITYKGNPVSANDLLSLGGAEPVKKLEPLVPVLTEIRR